MQRKQLQPIVAPMIQTKGTKSCIQKHFKTTLPTTSHKNYWKFVPNFKLWWSSSQYHSAVSPSKMCLEDMKNGEKIMLKQKYQQSIKSIYLHILSKLTPPSSFLCSSYLPNTYILVYINKTNPRSWTYELWTKKTSIKKRPQKCTQQEQLIHDSRGVG